MPAIVAIPQVVEADCMTCFYRGCIRKTVHLIAICASLDGA
jgi:hypothetical protein